MRRRGFTLIELLVVIAIIGILIALLLPAVQKVRDAANSMACRNNLKQIALACLNYEGTHGSFPAGSVYKSVGGSSNYYETWTISILPYLEQQALFALYDPAVPNAIPDASSPAMARLRQTFVKVYTCPSDPNPFEPAVPASGPGGSFSAKPLYMPGNYRCVAGADWGGRDWGKDQGGGNENWDDPNQISWLLKNYGGDRGVMHATNPSVGAGPERIANITDGTSNTLMVGEYATRTELDRRTFWAYAYTSFNESVVTFA
jgi:prepilin-type N-terminal cleavage/methylation domain-containing protein